MDIFYAVALRYNCSILDLYDRSIVAALNSDYINTELAKVTLEKALMAEKPAKGLILHSDQGCQFTSWDFINYCESRGICQSMSKAGCPYDNELIYPNYFYNADNLDEALKRYVYVWYNHVCLTTTRLTYRAAYDKLEKVQEQKGLSFHFHDIRHSFCSRLAQTGMDTSIIRIIMEHEHITTTQYTHTYQKRYRDNSVTVLGRDYLWRC